MAGRQFRASLVFPIRERAVLLEKTHRVTAHMIATVVSYPDAVYLDIMPSVDLQLANRLEAREDA